MTSPQLGRAAILLLVTAEAPILTVDDIPFGDPPDEPHLQLATPRKCRHPRKERVLRSFSDEPGVTHVICGRCEHEFDPELLRRGRNNRKRGNGHELQVARTYGGEKVGPLGLPEDVRGKEFRTQVKTHQGLAPRQIRDAFAKLEASAGDGRTNRLVLRYLPGMGVKPDDYIVIRGQDWLDRFGRDDG